MDQEKMIIIISKIKKRLESSPPPTQGGDVTGWCINGPKKKK
jgi:hypothetical protein